MAAHYGRFDERSLYLKLVDFLMDARSTSDHKKLLIIMGTLRARQIAG